MGIESRQNVVIVGGAGEIGKNVAALLLRGGANVTLLDVSEKNLDDVKRALDSDVRVGGGVIRCHVGNATEEAAVEGAVKLAAGREERLDIAIAVVGGGPVGVNTLKPLVLLDRDDFEATVSYNIMPAFLLIKHAANLMQSRRSGSIVAISSIASVLSTPLLGAYSIGKAALDTLIRLSADELGGWGIRVNAVRPGFIPDPMLKTAADSSYVDSYVAQQAIKRTGSSEDVAAMVAFLANDQSSWITGQCINVDGGISLHRTPKRDNEISGQLIPENWRYYLG